MVEVVVLVGLMASGKSTFYKERFAATHMHISKDTMPAVRKWERQAAMLTEALRDGRNVVVDNTNVSVAERAEVLDIAKPAGALCRAFVLNTRLVKCIERNVTREGAARVPPVGFWSAVDRFTLPDPSEGFDEINVVMPSFNDRFSIRRTYP